MPPLHNVPSAPAPGSPWQRLLHLLHLHRGESMERSRLAAIVESSDDAIVAKTLEGVVTAWNRGAEKLFGYPREEMLGRSIAMLFPPERLNEERAIIERIRRGDRVPPYETVRRRKDGTEVDVSVAISPIFDERGQIIGASKVARDITEQKRAKTELQATIERLQRIVEVETVGILFWDLSTGHLTDANDTFLRMMGYSRADVAARALTWQNLTPPEFMDVSRAEIRKFEATGRVGPYEKEYLRKDGTRQWLIFAGSALSANACVEFCVDISDRKRAEAALRDSEARFRAIYEHATDGMMVTAPSGEIVSANPAACRLLGRTEEEIRCAGRNQLVAPHDERLAAMLAQRVQSGHAAGELCLVRNDGSRFEAEVSSVIFDTAEGVRCSTVIHDITERRQRERQIREQAALLDKANEAIVASDLRGRITFWSHGAERLFGWTAAEMLDEPVESALTLGGVPADAPICRALTQGGDWRGEVSGHTRSGRPLTIEMSITMLRDDTGHPSGRLSISTDITEKKILQEQFLRAQRLESIGMLATGIAHDINNVLAPISLAAPILRARATDPTDLRLLDTLEKCAERGGGLVRQILGFAHGVGGEPRVVELNHLLRDVIGVITETFPKSIALEDDVPRELWAVVANPTQIHQVLLNLCVNARDAMPTGGTLRLRAENCRLDAERSRALLRDEGASGARPGAWVVLHVEDTGTGIPPEVLAHMWEPFFTTKRAGKGTGLGLSTVRGIVETHQGFVTLQTAAGRGTTFRVYFPAAEQERAAAAGRRRASTREGRGELILLADDERNMRETAAAILTASGYRVVTAGDGAEAAARFTAEPTAFALVVTDQDMPKVAGGEFAQIVRGYGATRILVMSGSDPAAGREVADAFLPKPFTAEALLAAVDALLSERRA